MENKNIIIIMLAIIVVLSAVLGVMYFQSANAKEPSKIKITSNKTLYEGESLSIKLTDLNKTVISNETVKIAIADKNGKIVVNETVKTNSKGNAKIDLELKKGKYNVTVTFGGNKNYTGNNTTQKLTIKEEVKTVSEESYSSGSGGYSTEPVYDGHTISYKDGVRGVYSRTGEFFVDPTQDPNYRTFN